AVVRFREPVARRNAGRIEVVARESVGVERGVAQKFIGGAMKIFLAALRDDAYLAASRTSILGVVIGGEDLHFLRRIHIGNADAGSVGAGANRRRAIKSDQVVLSAGAVNIQSASRQPKAVTTERTANHARLKDRQREWIGPVGLNVINLFAFDQF